MVLKRTTVLLDEELLQKAKKAVGAQSTMEVIDLGLSSLVRQANREALREELYPYDIELTLDDLEALRNASCFFVESLSLALCRSYYSFFGRPSSSLTRCTPRWLSSTNSG
jgi:hypothetical protein